MGSDEAARIAFARRLPNVTDLQSFYDSGAAQFVPELPRPLTAAGRTWLSGWVTDLVTEFPRTSFGPQLNDTDPQVRCVRPSLAADARRPSVWARPPVELPVCLRVCCLLAALWRIAQSWMLEEFKDTFDQVYVRAAAVAGVGMQLCACLFAYRLIRFARAHAPLALCKGRRGGWPLSLSWCFLHVLCVSPHPPAAVHPIQCPRVQCLRQRHQDAASAAGRVGGLPACSAAGFLPGRGRACLCPHPSPPKPSPARHPTHPRVRVALLCRRQLALQVPCEYCLLTKISFIT
jgi:hypothetical protein